MRIEKGGRIIAVVLAFSSLIAIIWGACTKPSANPNTCIGIVCENGAFCNVDAATKKPLCICPTGYEGPNCNVATVNKYLGVWNMMQIITGSDTASFNNDTSYYQVNLVNTATPTTFFIDNFGNDPYYNNIICTMDSGNSYMFVIDTISAYHLGFDHFQIVYGAGSIDSTGNSIKAFLATRHLSATSNWITDTISFIMTH